MDVRVRHCSEGREATELHILVRAPLHRCSTCRLGPRRPDSYNIRECNECHLDLGRRRLISGS
eukprot:scaffold152226_cov41-Attheya_sp.AAC.3